MSRRNWRARKAARRRQDASAGRLWVVSAVTETESGTGGARTPWSGL